VLLAVGGGTSAAVARPSPDLAWEVGPYDFVHYRVVEQEVDDSDAEDRYRRADAADLHGFYGYELDGVRRSVVRPITREPWLAVPFVYRIPATRVDDRAAVAIDEVVAGTWRLGPVRARGRLAIQAVREEDGRREIDVSGLVLLAPDAAGDDRMRAYRTLANGRLSWTATFDLEQGLMTRIVYDLEARTGQGGRELPRGVHALVPGERRYKEHLALELDRRYEQRWPGFRGAVDKAILTCCEWLESVQQRDGAFNAGGTWGTTGLALLALVRSGRPVTSPAVRKGFAWLLEQPPQGTYETGAVLMALEAWGTPPEEMARARRGELGTPMPRTLTPEAKAYAQRCADYLLDHVLEEEPSEKGPVTGRVALRRWGYPFDYHMNLEPEYRDWWDNSNTQYAVLGLNSAARCGVEIPRAIWLGIAEHYLSVQAPDGEEVTKLRLEPHATPSEEKGGRRYGTHPVTALRRGWAYQECRHASNAYGSMTCAGLASLAIARSHLESGPRSRMPAALRSRIDASIRDGWAALEGIWTVFENPGYEGWYLYHLYGLERAGILCDVESVQGHDWYWEGAIQLLLRQEKDGSWPTFSSEPHDAIWALLFLSRSTTPITPSR